ncbi:hypothetical protein R80B4_00946 [Fibrobacteres bacterium R8-0-B4]
MDRAKLKERIRSSGYRLGHILGQIGLTYQSFWCKMRGRTEFTLGEIERLSAILGLKASERDAIFFADSVITKKTRPNPRKTRCNAAGEGVSP